MSPEAGRPDEDLRRVAGAEQRFLAAIAELTDADVSRPSRLPGWTVGHVVAHVARNADSHVRRTEGAMRREVVDQYPGGQAGRAEAIERGACRSAEQLRADVAVSGEQLGDIWALVPDPVWGRVTRDVGGRERPLRQLPFRRWRELEVHAVDLNLGFTHRDWPAEFVAAWLPRLRQGLVDRLLAGAVAPPAGVLDERDELAWLYGRLDRPDLPVLESWDN